MPGVTTDVLGERVLGPQHKAFPETLHGLSSEQVAASGARFSHLSTPVLTLIAPTVRHNIAVMAGWVAEHGFLHAPHGKTSMSPQLWRQQLDAGAWAITVATVSQVRVARAANVPRVVLANQLIDPVGLAWVASELARDPGFEFVCWVDSVAGIELMDEALRAAGHDTGGCQITVCIEVGSPGSRCGVRSAEHGGEVACRVLRSPYLRLAGVAGFEGAAAKGDLAEQVRGVDDYLDLLCQTFEAVRFGIEAETPVITAGGSAYFDRVARKLDSFVAQGVRVIVRSGVYIAHDSVLYRETGPDSRGVGPGLKPAMHVWSRVLSLPEPGWAIVDAGNRDVPWDKGFPVPEALWRDGACTDLDVTGCAVTALNDQHGFVALPAGSEVRVGDVIRFGISHPCTGFDRWQAIPLLADHESDDPGLVGIIWTYF